MSENRWQVRRWMSRELKTVRPDAPLVDAFERMREHRIRHLPVVEGKKLVGILSDRDVREFYPHREHLRSGQSVFSERLMSTQVSEVMARQPHTVHSSTRLREVAELLCRKKIGALPVVDGQRLVGIITAEDVLWALVESFDDIEQALENPEL